MIKSKITILIADDDEEDLAFAEKAIKANSKKDEINIKFVKNGELLLDYIYMRNGYNELNAPRPTVIFLDINMPKLCGLSVLDVVKKDEALRSIPIIILSSSRSDIDPSYSKGANSYIVKPGVYGELEKIMGQMKEFWFEAAVLPGG